MSRSLPLCANLEWLKKLSKERLDALRRQPRCKTERSPACRCPGVRLSELAKTEGPRRASPRKTRCAGASGRTARRAAESVAPDDPDLARLLAAVSAGEMQAVTDLLTSRPALAAAHGPDGQTPLHVAAQHNDPQMAAALVAFGADVNAKFGQSGHSALSWAVTCNAPECARTLVTLGAKPDLFCAAGIGPSKGASLLRRNRRAHPRRIADWQ